MIDFKGVEYLTFDCYGTLIDWEKGITASLHPIFQRHDCAMPDAEILERYAAFEAAIESGPYVNYRTVLERVVDRFGELLGFAPTVEDKGAFSSSVGKWPAFPDSREALARLADRFRLVVLSNVDDDLFSASDELLGSPFHAVFTAQQIGSYKPDLRNFRFAIERLGGESDRIVHVAQSLFHDIAPARRLGLRTVWINRRHGLDGNGATPQSSSRPDVELTSLDELVRSIDDW
jgi:2-haloacid dehalogenase